KLVAAAFFARPLDPAAAAATPACRALTEVRAVGGFGAPAGVERFAELGPVPRPVRLVPLGAGALPEDFDAEDVGVEVRRTPAARRAPPFVGCCPRRERSDEPRDERRESLMAAPGPSGTRTSLGAAAVAVRTQPLSMTTTGAPAERPGGEAHRVCTSRAAPLTSGRGAPHTTSTRPGRAAAAPGRAPSGVLAGRPPGAQLLDGPLLAEGAVLHPQVEQVPVGLAHGPTGRKVQDLHDPVAVQVGADLPDLLLLGEVVDAGLELVVGA